MFHTFGSWLIWIAVVIMTLNFVIDKSKEISRNLATLQLSLFIVGLVALLVSDGILH